MKYIKRFDTLEEQTAYLAEADIDTYVGYVDENDTVYYDDAIPERYDNKYLTIETLTAGNLSITVAGSNVFQYSLDDGSTWNNLAFGQTVAIEANKKVLFKAEGLEIIGGNSGIGTINYSGDFNVYGNVMSLVYGDNFVGQEAMSNFQFRLLFTNNVALLSAENLILPATTLTDYCYSNMFEGCTNLTTAPQLPATTLANNCYDSMFWNCSNLTTAPELPATTLAQSCYANMFGGCTSLTEAPVLPATTLADNCYNSMFYNCTSLTTAPVLPATTLTQDCYNTMFYNCTRLNSITCLATNISASGCTNWWVLGVASSGTFVKNAAMNDWTTGANGIPSGWTVVDA